MFVIHLIVLTFSSLPNSNNSFVCVCVSMETVFITSWRRWQRDCILVFITRLHFSVSVRKSMTRLPSFVFKLIEPSCGSLFFAFLFAQIFCRSKYGTKLCCDENNDNTFCKQSRKMVKVSFSTTALGNGVWEWNKNYGKKKCRKYWTAKCRSTRCSSSAYKAKPTSQTTTKATTKIVLEINLLANIHFNCSCFINSNIHCHKIYYP